MSPLVLWLGIVLLVGSTVAADVPFVFDETSSSIAGYSSDQLERVSASSDDLKGVPQASSPSDDEIILFPNTGGSSAPGDSANLRVGEIRKTLNSRLELKNDTVHLEALRLAGKPGDYTIAQISSIYSDLKDGWYYFRDTRGVDNFNSATTSISLGKYYKCAGAGDCDDFAILMAALIESIGGTTRIILARNNTTGGHAYTEVYLGQLDSENDLIENIISWLKDLYETDKIFAHIETDTKEVWLNLDWGKDPDGNAHPGGPLYPGDTHIVVRINPNATKTIVNVPEKVNKLPKLISLTPDKSSPQDTGTSVTWTAEAKDPEKDELLYRFILNDEPVAKWAKENRWVWNTSEDDVGENQIEVRIRDGKHAGPEKCDSSKVTRFIINVPESAPVAVEVVANKPNEKPVISELAADKASPQEAGSIVTWTAEASDPEDDEIFYCFFLNDKPVTEWIKEKKWVWTTGNSGGMDYINFTIEAIFTIDTIDVRVRDGKHAGSDGFDDNKSVLFSIETKPRSKPEPSIDTKVANKPPTLHSLNADKESKDTGFGKAASITWTAAASDPDKDPVLYKFWLRGPSTGGNWTVVQGWSTMNQWTWITLPSNAGSYFVYVYARDGKHASATGYDCAIGQKFILEGDRFYLIHN